jgi:hypothetical protein
VSPCLTILLFAVLFACSLSAVLGPVRVFAVRCSHVVLMRVTARIRHGCYMQRYIGSCSYLDNLDSVLSVILMFSVFLWLLAADCCAVN